MRYFCAILANSKVVEYFINDNIDSIVFKRYLLDLDKKYSELSSFKYSEEIEYKFDYQYYNKLKHRVVDIPTFNVSFPFINCIFTKIEYLPKFVENVDGNGSIN